MFIGLKNSWREFRRIVIWVWEENIGLRCCSSIFGVVVML